MKHARGFTIVQLMLALLMAGIAARLVVDFVIEKRCESMHAAALCTERNTAPK